MGARYGSMYQIRLGQSMIKLTVSNATLHVHMLMPLTLDPWPLMSSETTLWSGAWVYYPFKHTVGGPFWRKYTFLESVHYFLCDVVLKNGFGFTILILVFHWAHGQPPIWWMVFPMKSLRLWKPMTFNCQVMFIFNKELLGIFFFILAKQKKYNTNWNHPNNKF